ncbi:hypothetical protein [Halovivax cerinus]|uniref:Uncharacterized protein n=1 Tax=Halovivax cerinus TaxID=1487865 RepID=A0ABD5NJK9_9EURY|nr:hypothetical protein [Halovivax cerinus]
MPVDRHTFVEMVRTEPIESAMFTALPAVLAIVQLVNSALTELSYLVSVSFAVVLVGYAWLVTSYSVARFRRRRLDGLV